MKAIHETNATVNRAEKILQFGEGNFLRAFVDWMVDITNEKTDFNGNIVMVQPLDRGMSDQINAQKGLYTTVLRGVQDGKTVEETRLITSVSRCLNTYAEHEAYMKIAESDELRFVISNTTEAGIAYDPAAKADDAPQASFPGKVTAFLYRRFTRFKGDEAKGLVFIPCELIDKNGDKLREIVLRHADEWKLGKAFTDWVEKACDFCNSLVDRIVPGYPKDEADTLCGKLGYKDNLLVTAEIFHLWVIESSKDYSVELPLAQAGLNVIWTKDMSFYRTRKVRILNGAHTMTVPSAFLYGLDSVEECIKDPLVHGFMKKGIFEEIIPSMLGAHAQKGDQEALTAYANDVLERFANPYINHMLLSITLNSVSKFKTRNLPSLLAYMDIIKSVPPALSFSLAALIAFYEIKTSVNGEYTGLRGEKEYPIKDDLPVLERFTTLYGKGGSIEDKAARLSKEVLSDTSWWGEDLTARPGLEDAVRKNLADIWSRGISKALEALCGRY